MTDGKFSRSMLNSKGGRSKTTIKATVDAVLAVQRPRVTDLDVDSHSDGMPELDARLYRLWQLRQLRKVVLLKGLTAVLALAASVSVFPLVAVWIGAFDLSLTHSQRMTCALLGAVFFVLSALTSWAFVAVGCGGYVVRSDQDGS